VNEKIKKIIFRIELLTAIYIINILTMRSWITVRSQTYNDIFLTVLSGFLFLFLPIFLKLVIEPIQKLRSTIASVGYVL